MLKKFLDKLFVKRRTPPATSNKKEVFIPLMFLGKISFMTKKKLQSIFCDCGRGFKLKNIFSSPNRLCSGFSFKDRLPRELDSMLLYKFTCGACNCTYIGETKRHFQVRSHEHMGLCISLPTNYLHIMLMLQQQLISIVMNLTMNVTSTILKLFVMPAINSI